VLGSSRVEAPTPPPPSATVKAIGAKLMSDYVVPLEVVGLLLTAALIGAVVIAMHEKRGGSQP
jgi:NADH-quinone oxidoreductase subunit J